MGFFQAAHAPVLNDVSTDLDDPPAYIVANKGPLPDAFKPLIRKAYPDMQPVRVQAAPDVALDAATAAARSMPRWEVVSVGPDQVVEAVATTRLMRFKDDVVIRVRPQAEQQRQQEGPAVLRIDVRSRSRLGKGDMGANAARIREYAGRLREELRKRGATVLE